MNLNLFGDDDDAQSSSGFSANLKMETYNSVVVTFNSIVANADDAKANAKDTNPGDKDKSRIADDKSRIADDKSRIADDKAEGTKNIHILTQKMIVANSNSEYVVDLDEEQKKTQSTSCDYLVYVPTSLNVAKETVDAFYETNFQFKKMFGKLNMKDAAATVFMQLDLFQKFVKYANQKSRKRALQWIQQSFQYANDRNQVVVNDMKNVRNLSVLSQYQQELQDEKGDERFVILYTTPVSTSIPIATDHSLRYLPLMEKFNPIIPGFGGSPAGNLNRIVSQKTLTHYYNYFQWFYVKNDNANNIWGSFGRILNYVPPLNSKMADVVATRVSFNSTPLLYYEAIPSYNVEIVTNFLRGIITGNNLPNRNVLRNDNKLKVIQEKTRLYTFKSTPDYNLNYEKLLERLYYKYPCHLTPNAKVTKEEKKAMTDAALAAAAVFNGCMDAAIGASDKTKSHSIICAVAIATREFIYHNTKTTVANIDANAILNHLFTIINFGSGLTVLKPQIQARLIAYNVAPFVGRQLNPLIGAACAAGDAVYAAAKLAITNYVKDNAATNAPASLAAIKKAMDSVIDNFDNFAAFAYDNDTLLSLLKYSDKAQAVDNASVINGGAVNVNINPANLMEKADYLKTLYKKSATKEEKSEAQQQKDEFETVHDDDLYVICGPVYFDYTWIFKQNPELIKHILGEMSEKDLKELKDGWTPVEDPLTENKYHINPNPEEKSYPKMRFDNPTQMPTESRERPNSDNTGYSTYSWKEQYVSPSQAMMDKTETQIVQRGQTAAQLNYNNLHYRNILRDTTTWVSHIQRMLTPIKTNMFNALYNWTTPGYYQYECTQQITRRNPGGVKTKWENKRIQLMRPPTYENGLQDYTEPNLPTAYPPPLMSIVPPFRGPANTFIIHAWIPGETFIAEDGTLNQRGCMDYMYKMMQLIFKTAEKNASDTASKKRICIKIAAIGYESQDMKSLRKINRPEDKQFIGDAFFSAARDYSMLYESIIHVTLYYDTTTQSGIKTRYDDYVGQRLSVLRKSNPLALDTSLHLKIANMDDFFTLKWYPDTDQLSKNDLLYFVDYCSSPRAFIGNMGEWPENIEDVMDDAIKTHTTQPLIKCLHDAFNSINNLYADRGIKDKMTQIMSNLQNWNLARPLIKINQDQHMFVPAGFNKFMKILDDLCADSGAVGQPQIGSNTPNALFISWWMATNIRSDTFIPCNAYISSFDEHVMILHNLLSNSNDINSAVGGVNAGWANNTASFYNPDNVNPNVNLRNTSVNYGPYVVNSFAQNRNDTFENAVYAYTQAKKILTLLSKMKYDEIQITKANQEKVSAALAALNAYNVKMSWSMDAKFTAAVAEGAFIPNSSALHNPFMCPALLDPKEWQFMDFDDVGVREIAGAKPVSTLLKPFIDAKIRGSDASSSSSLTRSNALIISKQPNMSILGANFAVILENMFHRNARMQYDGKNMVFNNYAWNQEFFYKKRNDRAVLQQLTSTNESKSPDFASLMGIRASPGRCIQFPLFAVQLAMYLYQGNLADMTGMDMARLSCSLDGSMFKTNAQILWDQMMNGLKTHSQNFTVEHVLGRLGHPLTKEEYEYTAKWDLPPPPPPPAPGTAAALIAAVTGATNPTLKTTNVETLKEIQRQIGANPSALYTNGVNNLTTLIGHAEAYDNAELNAVNGQTASLGWNAATQRESTVLYMNKMAKKNGAIVNIASELMSLKPGDKIYIIDETAGNNLLTKLVPTKRQVWRVTGKPIKNATKDNIIDVPVTYAVRPYNVTSVFRDIANSSSLTVTLERFSEE